MRGEGREKKEERGEKGEERGEGEAPAEPWDGRKSEEKGAKNCWCENPFSYLPFRECIPQDHRYLFLGECQGVDRSRSPAGRDS